MEWNDQYGNEWYLNRSKFEFILERELDRGKERERENYYYPTQVHTHTHSVSRIKGTIL